MVNNTDVKEQRESIAEIEKQKIKLPFPSVRYSTPDEIIKIKPKLKDEVKIKEKPLARKLEQFIQKQEIPESTFHDDTENVTIKEQEVPSEISEIVEESVSFIDIEKEIKLIHLYGAPSSGKTTFALQSAIEILPRKTYYIITSHYTALIKRIKQMIGDERWKNQGDIKQCFFPIQIQSLEELITQLEKIKKLDASEIGLIIIDHFTDYVRGEIYKEENRARLRNILETLYLICDEKKCKSLLLNGFSFKDSAPAEDLVESFCDMTLRLEKDGMNSELIVEDEMKVPYFIDNSGVKNLHINIYFQN